jgi:hypothetical protein
MFSFRSRPVFVSSKESPHDSSVAPDQVTATITHFDDAQFAQE